MKLVPKLVVRQKLVVGKSGAEKMPMPEGPLTSSATAAAAALAVIGDRAYEHFVTLYFDARLHLLGYDVATNHSRGAVTFDGQSLVRNAMLVGARAMITAHQHPSGNREPSAEDVATWRRLRAMAGQMEVEVLDNFVLTSDGRYWSEMEGGGGTLKQNPSEGYYYTLEPRKLESVADVEQNPSDGPMRQGKIDALLAKSITFEGRLLTKRAWIEELVRRGAALKLDRYSKHVFSRTKYNRMDHAEQRAYDEKMKEKMPFAAELPDGTFYEITKTEADYFKSLGGQTENPMRSNHVKDNPSRYATPSSKPECFCEHESATHSHGAGSCTRAPTQGYQVKGLGPVCKTCWDSYPREYQMQTNPRGKMNPAGRAQAWFSFEDGKLRAPSGPLSQQTCDEIWDTLPTTGSAWIEKGRLFVQQADDGSPNYDLGPVAPGVALRRHNPGSGRPGVPNPSTHDGQSFGWPMAPGGGTACPKCGSTNVLRTGSFSAHGTQAIRCRACGKTTEIGGTPPGVPRSNPTGKRFVCPLCNEEHRDLKRHMDSAHESEMEQRRRDPNDPVAHRTSDMQITSDDKWHDFVYRYDVPAKVIKDQFDYLDADTDDGFFKYRNTWYHTSEFMRTTMQGWDGSHGDSYFSGVLIKLSSDGEKYKIARYFVGSAQTNPSDDGREVFTGWRTVKPGKCMECGSDDGWNVDGRGTVYCDCQRCSECNEFDGHDANCSELENNPSDTSERMFIAGYMEAAFWSSNDESDEQGGEPLDANYDKSDLDPDTKGRMERDCLRFMEQNADDLAVGDADSAQAGHDFWLTRNGHGAGFWDRPKLYGGKAVADRLSAACKVFGEYDLYVGDDKMIYGSGKAEPNPGRKAAR